MKNVISIIFILLIVSELNAQSTPWISQGAKWFYKVEPNIFAINDKIEYTHDTIISGITSQVLKTTRYTYITNPPQLVSVAILPYNFTYNSGDTVFYYYDNKFNVLYNFGAQPGDNWDLGVDTNDMDCSASIVRVDSVSSLNINSSSYRVLHVSDSVNSSVGFYGSIIEHIGSMNYLFPLLRNCDSTSIVEFYQFSFLCFEDSSMSYKVVQPEECQNPHLIGINEANNSNKIKCSPNPASDKLYVTLGDNANYKICVYNVFGQMVIEALNISADLVTLDVLSLKPGLYVVSITNENGKIDTETFVKE